MMNSGPKIMSGALSLIKEQDFRDLLARCGANIKTDAGILFQAYKDHRLAHEKGAALPAGHPVRTLEDRWYSSLLTNYPDYSVYLDDFYFCDIWLCWVLYSRKSIQALLSPRSLISKSVVDFLNNNRTQTILDLGCGFAYTTAALKEIFPSAKVIGTNIEHSFQYHMAKDMGRRYDFTIEPSSANVGAVSVVFASEYFEHFERPAEHLSEVIKANRPRCMILANGFLGRAIGHFNVYRHLDRKLTNKQMSKFFNEVMRFYGYKKLKTKIWNNRPSVWIRK